MKTFELKFRKLITERIIEKMKNMIRQLVIYPDKLDNRYIQKQTCNNVAIIFIGLGKYFNFFPKFYKINKKFFLSKTKKMFFVFTDQSKHRFLDNKLDTVSIQVEHLKWPYPTLFRFKYILQISKQLEKYSHIVFIDADMLCKSQISEEEFFSHHKPLFGVKHPCFIDKIGTFEFNPDSLACIEENDDRSIYWQGCLWGGKTSEVLKLSKELVRRIDDDLSRGVIAIWHDESHLNKYFIEHKDEVHTFGPEYAYPESMSFPYEKKFLHLKKEHGKIRN